MLIRREGIGGGFAVESGLSVSVIFGRHGGHLQCRSLSCQAIGKRLLEGTGIDRRARRSGILAKLFDNFGPGIFRSVAIGGLIDSVSETVYLFDAVLELLA
jgi:hypothetical protein